MIVVFGYPDVRYNMPNCRRRRLRLFRYRVIHNIRLLRIVLAATRVSRAPRIYTRRYARYEIESGARDTNCKCVRTYRQRVFP